MNWNSEAWRQLAHSYTHPKCPYCGEEVDMTDVEYASRHITYWGEDGPKPNECPSCDTLIYISERVDRSWTVGKSDNEDEWDE